MSTFVEDAKREVRKLSEQARKEGLTKEKWTELVGDEINDVFSRPVPSAVPLEGERVGRPTPDRKKGLLGTTGADEDDTK